MLFLLTDTAMGYALIMGGILLVVIIYSVIKLRKQVRDAKSRERKKKKKDSHP